MPSPREAALVAFYSSVLVALFVGALTLAGCSPANAAPPPRVEAPIPVRLAKVERGPLTRAVRGSGLLRGSHESDLGFEMGGRVVALLVDDGAKVKKGQPLARLDATSILAARAQAVEAAAKADRDLARAKGLMDKGALALSDLQNAETGAAVAHASVTSANDALARTTLLAPRDGRIDKRLVELGEIAAPGRPVFRLAGVGGVVRIAVSDRDVGAVHVGARAVVTLDVSPNAPHGAAVSKVATAASPGAGTFEIEVALDALPASTPSGLTAKVAIAHDEKPAATVPIAALVDGEGHRAHVFVVRDGRARRLPVQIAFLQADKAALAAPLEADAVVADGAPMLVEGSAVEVSP